MSNLFIFFVKLIGVQLGGEFPVTVRGFVDNPLTLQNDQQLISPYSITLK